MSCSRRQLLRGGAAAAALAALGVRPAWGNSLDASSLLLPGSVSGDGVPDDIATLVEQDAFKKLAMEAIEAAKDAGADYADVRLTRSVSQLIFAGAPVMTNNGVFESQYVAVGVRVLIDNAWGFASSPYWRMKEMQILAKSAAEQAKANSVGAKIPVELAKTPPVTGTWTMPVRIDPFTIPLEERIDFLTSWIEFANNSRRATSSAMPRMSFKRMERALATTEGTFVTQTTYESSGEFRINVNSIDWRRQGVRQMSAKGLETSGSGWELFLDANIPAQVPKLLEQADELASLALKPVELGRYEIVLDAATTGQLLSSTIGTATELDRSMGFEANASGTSYLSPPLEFLNRRYQVASQLVTVKGNRSVPGGAATIKWDDEGVEPDTFALVENGVLNDFQTTREQAPWLAPWYKANNRLVRSHGCAASDSAMRITMQHTPNLELQPGPGQIGFNELVASTRRGLAFMGGEAWMDYQVRTGSGNAPIVREIVNGQLGAIIPNASYQISASFWRTLTALGGANSVERTATIRFKGDPLQSSTHTVSAVPAKFRNVNVFDAMRRA